MCVYQCLCTNQYVCGRSYVLSHEHHNTRRLISVCQVKDGHEEARTSEGRVTEGRSEVVVRERGDEKWWRNRRNKDERGRVEGRLQ